MSDFNTTYKCFIKAIPPEYAASFYNKGEIYFNTFGFYQELEEKDTNIGDSKENIFMSIPKGYVNFPSEKKINNLEDIQHLIESGQNIPMVNALGAFKNEKDVIHCLCLSSYRIEENSRQKRFELDPAFVNEYSGHRFFLIIEYELYLKKIIAALQRLGYNKIESSSVEYFSKVAEFIYTTGNPFKKREKYGYQNEFRILVKKETLGPLTVNIGSLSDIAKDITTLMVNSFNAHNKQS